MPPTAQPPTALLPGPDGPLEYLENGSGPPVTLFVHGLASSIAQTRPFGSGVSGRRIFMHLRGHGASSAPPSPWTYPALAEEVRAVADDRGATRALGVSLGAGALLALVAQAPQRFQALVLVLPAVIDAVRPGPALARLAAMADLVDAGDTDGVARLLREDQPPAVRDVAAVAAWSRAQAATLVGTPVSAALRAIPWEVPLPDGDAAGRLRRVEAPVLLLAQEGDDVHPVDVAVRLAGLLPRAQLEVLPPGGILWTHRRRVRDLVSGFLAGAD